MQYIASCNVSDELYDLLLKLIVCDKEAWCPYTSFIFEGSVLVNISRSIITEEEGDVDNSEMVCEQSPGELKAFCLWTIKAPRWQLLL